MADDQPDIRIALRRRRRAVGLTQEEAATLLGAHLAANPGERGGLQVIPMHLAAA